MGKRGARLFSPNVGCISCLTSCQTTEDLTSLEIRKF